MTHDENCEAQGPGEDCCCVYRAEIERLRTDVREMAATIEGQVGVVIGLQNEIERLREALVNLRSAGGWVRDVIDLTLEEPTND